MQGGKREREQKKKRSLQEDQYNTHGALKFSMDSIEKRPTVLVTTWFLGEERT